MSWGVPEVELEGQVPQAQTEKTNGEGAEEMQFQEKGGRVRPEMWGFHGASPALLPGQVLLPVGRSHGPPADVVKLSVFYLVQALDGQPMHTVPWWACLPSPLTSSYLHSEPRSDITSREALHRHTPALPCLLI